MKKIFKSKLFLQVIVASIFATLATAGIVGAVTTIGANISTAGTLGTATTTIALGDLVVDTNTLIVKYIENRVGIGTTTPGSTLSVTSTGVALALAYDGGGQASFSVDSSDDLTIVASGGDISFDNENLTTTGNLAFATASSTGAVQLASISTTATGISFTSKNLTSVGDIAFATASSTGTVKLSVITSDTGAISFGNENLTTTGTLTVSGALTALATTTVSADFTVGTTDFYVDDDNAKVGISSTTPWGKLSVGTAGATSTISMGYFCMAAQTEAGTLYYVRFDPAQKNVFATSTTSCF